MGEEAHTWVLPVLEDLKKGHWPYLKIQSIFEKEFIWQFIPLDPRETAREQIKHLKQGKSSVTKYKAKFDEQLPLAGWSEINL